MKYIALRLVRIYQKTLSPDHGVVSWFRTTRTCRFYPSCSEYTYIAIERFGVLRGVWMGCRRLSRCHPWSKRCGHDPVPKKEEL